MSLVLVCATCPGCGYSSGGDSDSGSSGADASNAHFDSGPSPDAACGAPGDPCPPDDVDADDDGIPDSFDRDPDRPQNTVVEAEFSDDPSWVVDGDGIWGWNADGWIEQSGSCDDRGPATTYEPVDGMSVQNLYAEVKVRVPTCAGQVEGRGAGVFVRKADGRLLACLFNPTLPEEDATETALGDAYIRVVLLEGENLESATATEIHTGHFGVDWTQDGEVGPHWSEQWVTVRLLVDSDDVYCEIRPGERWDSWGKEWTGVSPEIPAGTAGVIAWGGPASFDDFRVVQVD